MNLKIISGILCLLVLLDGNMHESQQILLCSSWLLSWLNGLTFINSVLLMVSTFLLFWLMFELLQSTTSIIEFLIVIGQVRQRKNQYLNEKNVRTQSNLIQNPRCPKMINQNQIFLAIIGYNLSLILKISMLPISTRYESNSHQINDCIIEQFIQINKQQVQLMKRPQSAKHGYRGPAQQNSTDQIREEDLHPKHANRKPVKLMKPDLTTNDFARIMPKKIFQDKQRLYSQGLQLKQKLNEFHEENIRLKTRISILEKEKDKLTKAIDVAAESTNKSQSRFKMYQAPNKPSDVQNTRVRNLTKMIRQSKQENEYLKQENAKIKKAVKFTKINEVEIECKILREEYQKLQELLTQMYDKLADQDDYEHQISELKNQVNLYGQENKELKQSNNQYVQYIEQLEQKLKKQSQKNKERQTKLQRQIALHKRKMNQAIKISDDLRKQLRALKQTSQNIEAKKKQLPIRNITRPQTSNPYNKQDNKEQQQVNIEAQNKLEQLRQKNQKLEKELKEIKLKLEKSEKQNKHSEAPKNQNAGKEEKKPEMNGTQNLRVDSEPKDDYEDDQDFNSDKSPQKKKQETGDNFILKEQTKIKPQQQDYDDEFEKEQKQGQKQKQSPSKKVDPHVQDYNKDLGQNGDEEQIYRKQDDVKVKQKKKKKTEDDRQDKKDKKGDKKKGNYEPDKKILTEIKQLLTYRMKAQRYPYEDLKNDIIASKQTVFSYVDLENMMKTQPFYLTPAYVKAFLQYVFERKDKNINTQSVASEILLNKLRKVIKDFELLDEKEEQEKLMSIAEMTTQYPNQLESAFEKIKNGPDTVAKKDLIQMFKKLELADHFIQIIIAQLSLCSQDLEHLSIRGYFQRFYIDQMQNSNAIDQQQIQSSGQQQQQTNIGKNKKIHKIDEQEQYEDDKVNFIMEDEAELSMKGKIKNQNQNQNQHQDHEDVISDDGRI